MYSLGLAIAMLLLFYPGYGTLPVSSFSDNFSVQPNNSTTGNIGVYNENGFPVTTALNDKPVSDTDTLNAFPPEPDNTQGEPIPSGEGSSDSSLQSSDITLVSTSPNSDDKLDTNSATTYQDSSSPGSLISSSAEAGLNSSGLSSGVTGSAADVSSDIGQLSATDQPSTYTNESSTQNSQIPTEGSSGATASDGSGASLPSNGTAVEVGGSSNQEQPSAESTLNQSAVGTLSSANQSGVTNANSGVNGSYTGLSSTHPALNETVDVGSGSLLANDLQVQQPFSDTISIASPSDPNAVTQDISTGDAQPVSFGDISNQNNVSAEISLDKSAYNLQDSPKVTIADGEANVDPNAINTVQALINSTSDETGIPITLTETGENTGIFEGVFSFTTGPSSPTSGAVQVASGDNIGINYIGTHPRMNAEIGGVIEGGSVTLKETLVTEDKPIGLIGGAVELTFSDQVVLGPNEVPVPDCPEEICAGKTIVTMSYANAPLGDQIPKAFTIWQNVPGVGWINLRDYQQFQPPGSNTTIQVHTDKQTVTAYSPFKGGTFSIGIDAPGGGGGGGGIGLPGAGIVLDLIAPITSSPPAPPSPSPPPTTGQPPATGTEDETLATGQDTDPSASDINSTSTSTTGAATGPATTSTAGGTSPAIDKTGKSGNNTIIVPGEGNITISFENLVSEGDLTVSALKTPSELESLKITKGGNQTGKLSALDNTAYDVVGTVFVIGPSDARLNGTATVSIPYDPNLTDASGEAVRMLYFKGSSWEDVTTSPPADGRFVTGTISTFGPVVAAVKGE